MTSWRHGRKWSGDHIHINLSGAFWLWAKQEELRRPETDKTEMVGEKGYTSAPLIAQDCLNCFAWMLQCDRFPWVFVRNLWGCPRVPSGKWTPKCHGWQRHKEVSSIARWKIRTSQDLGGACFHKKAERKTPMQSTGVVWWSEFKFPVSDGTIHDALWMFQQF